jgi:hypothetical protein
MSSDEAPFITRVITVWLMLSLQSDSKKSSCLQPTVTQPAFHVAAPTPPARTIAVQDNKLPKKVRSVS